MHNALYVYKYFIHYNHVKETNTANSRVRHSAAQRDTDPLKAPERKMKKTKIGPKVLQNPTKFPKAFSTSIIQDSVFKQIFQSIQALK